MDGVYIRGNGPNATLIFDAVTISNTKNPVTGDSATMTMIFDSATIGKVVLKDVVGSNLGQPIGITLLDVGQNQFIDQLWIVGKTNLWYNLSRVQSRRLHNVYFVGNTTDYHPFCAVAGNVYVDGKRVCP